MNRILTGFSYLIVTLTIMVIACSLPSLPSWNSGQPIVSSKPAITLSRPTMGAVLDLNSEIKIESTSLDPNGIAKVELLINGELVRIDGNAHPQSNDPFIVAQPWKPTVSGSYLIQVKAYNTKNSFAQADVTVEVGASPPTNTATVIPPTPSATVTPYQRQLLPPRQRP
jgi:hypothetical protein